MSDFDPDIPVVEQLVSYPAMTRFIDSMPHAVFYLDASGQVMHANDLCNRLFGRQVTSADFDTWQEFFYAQDQKRIKSAWKHLVKTQQPMQLEVKVQREDSSIRLANLRIVSFVDESGEQGYLGHAEDITIIRQLSEAGEENERRLAIMLEVMSEGVVLQDNQGQIMLSNPAAEDVLGLTNEQLCGRSSIDPNWRSVHEDGSDYPGSEHPAMKSLATGAAIHNQVMGVHKPDGSLTWISINSVPLFDGRSDKPYSVVASFSDITELKNARDTTLERLNALHLVQVELEMRQRELEEVNSQLRGLADTDVLTGLKNRRALFDRLRAEAALAERNSVPFSFALFDVDFFKSINDSFGHMAGDEVLKRVSKALTSCARVSDLVARYGGEEFAVVMPHTSKSQAEHAVGRILEEIRRIRWASRQVTASAGVAFYVKGASSIDTLIEDADTALYAAKGAGRNCVVLAA